jgi:polyamine oxidase
MAGLAAADAARHSGADVVVLEARDRIGGRTWTAPLGPGSIDLGGAWVHDPVGNPMAEALASAGIQAKNDGPYFSRMAVWSGEWLDATHATALPASIGADWDPSAAAAALPDTDRFVDGVEWYLADRELNGGVAELVRFGLLWIMGPLVTAGPPDRISLAGTAAYMEAGGGNLVPKGGYRALVDRLATDLDVRLRAPVTSIDHGGDEVVVHSNGETLGCDRVIATVPLGVLKAGTLSFDPPLGPGQAGAVERLAMGTLEKIAFRFSERFWPESLWQITHVADDHSFPVWFDFTRHVEAPTMIALYNPTVTPGLAERPPEQRVEPALEALRNMFGSVPDPEEILITDWTGDQWARGSYSYIPLGATVDDMKSLAEPVSDRVFLAGEATVPASYGTVHAAFSSGLRAAAQALGKRPERLSLGPVAEHWADG